MWAIQVDIFSAGTIMRCVAFQSFLACVVCLSESTVFKKNCVAYCPHNAHLMFSSTVRMHQQCQLPVFIQSLQNSKIKACLMWTNGLFVFMLFVCVHGSVWKCKAGWYSFACNPLSFPLSIWSQYLTNINNYHLWKCSDVFTDIYWRLYRSWRQVNTSIKPFSLYPE